MRYKILFLFYLYFIVALPVLAEETKNNITSGLTTEEIETKAEKIRQRTEVIDNEEADLTDKIAALTTQTITKSQLDDADLKQVKTKIALQDIHLSVESTKTGIENQQSLLVAKTKEWEELQQSEQVDKAEKIAALETLITEYKANIILQQDYLRNLEIEAELLARESTLAIKWYEALKNSFQIQQQQDFATRITLAEERYQQTQAKLTAELEKLSAKTPDNIKYYQTETQLKIADKEIWALKFEYIQKQLDELQQQSDSKDPNAIAWQFVEIKALNEAINDLQALLEQKISIIHEHKNFIDKWLTTTYLSQTDKALAKKIKASSNEFYNDLSKKQQDLKEIATTVVHLWHNFEQQYLFMPHHLPETWSKWKALGEELMTLPVLFNNKVHQISQSFFAKLKQLSLLQWIIIILSIMVWLNLTVWLRKFTHYLIKKVNNVLTINFATKHILIMAKLFYRNYFVITLLGIFVLLLWFIHLDVKNIVFISAILFSLLVLKILLNSSHVLLFGENKSLTTEQKSLSRQLKWTFITTTLFIVIVIDIHFLPVSLTFQGLVDRIFMVFLAITILPVMRIRSLLLENLANKLKHYWRWVIKLTSLLIPLTILMVSFLGAIGYVNLGWYVAQHLSLFLLVFTAWLVVHGLLKDTISFLKNLALRYSKQGLLWTQDIIPLFDKLLSIGLILLAGMVFFHISGWNDNIAIMDSIKTFWQVPIFHFEKQTVSVGDVLLAIFTLWAIFWLGSWAKNITYRWIYIGIHDLGIRNSLSIFTQYTIILIGLLITFRIIGLDLTTLTIFAGALGVGLGFGLQNIANNFISGILLLIGRPLRTGDIVSIGNAHEGEVKEIGIRSLTIETWDKKEVIVPNSDLISQAFTNWTHSDGIVRTTLLIETSYQDEPAEVMAIFKTIMEDMPQILKKPEKYEYNIYLTEFANSAIRYRIDYHINMDTYGLLTTKSKVLLTIWEHFKQAGITIPYPQQDIHVKTLPKS